MAENRKIEDLLRQSLASRAKDVQPDPATWQRVAARIGRQRTFRLSLAGFTAATALILAGVLVPALLNRSAVDLGPGDRPAPDTTEPSEDVVTLAPQEGLPEAVATMRQRIHEAARSGDWEALQALMAPDFTSSFGGADGPGEAVSMLRAMQEQGEDPLGLMARLLEMPHGVLAAESAGHHYGWPRPFLRTPDEWDDEDLAMLRTLGSEEDIEGWRAFGGYTGWRLIIAADGTWTAFVAGD